MTGVSGNICFDQDRDAELGAYIVGRAASATRRLASGDKSATDRHIAVERVVEAEGPSPPWISCRAFPLIENHPWLQPVRERPSPRDEFSQLRAENEAPHHPGGRLRRQRQGAPGAADVASPGSALPRAAGGGGRAAGTGGHRVLHAPARRSRRLEYAAQGRALGADVPEREVHLLGGASMLLGGRWWRAKRRTTALSPTACFLPVMEARQALLVASDHRSRTASTSRRPTTTRREPPLRAKAAGGIFPAT